MAESEKTIEEKLIEELSNGDSQWTYCPQLNTEEALWDNLRHILNNNNKAILDGVDLSDQEFEQIKNQLSFNSFFSAAQWISGENGKALLDVQRDNRILHLVALNRYDVNGGTSVYQVINQYKALKDEADPHSRNRRFDVTLLINGLPLIHIELKNREHPYMDAFRQIKKYITEGKFTGIFSCTQMFVVSNAVNTKYIAAAASDELNERFLSGWADKDNNPITDYLDFARAVLRIPEAHQMITQYSVLDNKADRIILLRPYQIHAIEAIRDASTRNESGFIWHTTGSGKTLTSYKVARNLLQEIPSIEKSIFLIDRKALDAQTTQAFQSYADYDVVDVDETDNTEDLATKFADDKQQMIVTTIQKMSLLIKRLQNEVGSKRYEKIHGKKIAFVVDECHRTISAETKRTMENFFINSLWYGFTGTPIFRENANQMLGDLPRTTRDMYGPCLHKYTVQHAIHDHAVLGFLTEYLGPEGLETDSDGNNINENFEYYSTKHHRLQVIDTIINKSYAKLGLENGSGRTYEGILTTGSIPVAQEYYKLFRAVKNGEIPEVQIDEKIKRMLPDFPKVAITYSLSENEERSVADQAAMQQSLDDYNEMFGTHFSLDQIEAYNLELTDRLARKKSKYKSRAEQIDIVLVADRLLTGFDAPCLSALFIDRKPVRPHDLIQMFSRTNRLFDKKKTSGQIVTFQSPGTYKNCVDEALVLYSDGGEASAMAPEWVETELRFKEAISNLRDSAATPEDVALLSDQGKKKFAKAFQSFDHWYAQIRAFTNFADKRLSDYGMTDEEYEAYVGNYKNVMDELYGDSDSPKGGDEIPGDDDPALEYELISYDTEHIDYEYIVSLIQAFVSNPDVDMIQRQKIEKEITDYIDRMSKDNPKLYKLMDILWTDIKNNPDNFKDQQISSILANMKDSAIKIVADALVRKWYLDEASVYYSIDRYRPGMSSIPNENRIKNTANYALYNNTRLANGEEQIPKFIYYKLLVDDLRVAFETEISPLLSDNY